VDFARLRRMSGAEIAGRGRQQALTWADRLGGGARPRTPAGELDPSALAGAADPRTAARAAGLAPDACAATVAAADRALEGRFDLLGYEDLWFGDPIDWRLDPVSGVRSPLVHWSRLDVLDRAQVGDSKVPWELNRHQWLVGLGQAYRLTGDEKYRDAFHATFGHWLAANPRGRGIAWASSLEVALRLIAWCWAAALFGEAPEGMAESAADHAVHVERHLSTWYAPNTHLTGEALGLVYAGLVLPDARRAGQWRALGARVLADQMERQILADGVHFERATCYQRYTAEIYLHALILGVELSRPRLEALLEFLLWTRSPDGAMPAIGDADGGWLLPLARRSPDDLRGVLSTAAAILGRADLAEAAAGLAPETVWLLGPDVEAPTREAPAGGSRLFPDGGYAVMREDAHRLIFDVGPLGEGGHTHADLLSIQLAAFGEPYIVDPGSYCYSADPAERDRFRGTAAHSTLTVDGRGQAEPARLFHWRSRPQARLLCWDEDVAEAEHDAYAPVVHRRRVLFDRSSLLWVVEDELDGEGEHRVDLRFQLAPLRAELVDGWCRVRGNGGHGLLLHTFSEAPLASELSQGWVSPDYGRRVPAPLLTHSVTAALPLRLVTLLVPLEDPAEIPVEPACVESPASSG
jgi:hypothetical protein